VDRDELILALAAVLERNGWPPLAALDKHSRALVEELADAAIAVAEKEQTNG
jgi:hypothetical protein